ncbi:MAG: bifunctional diguanylate cyclase/phosphodiesterase [Pseudomonadota bacterium]
MNAAPDIARQQFIQSLDAAVDDTRKQASDLGLLLIDLTNLASINHYHGYEFGDRLLAAAYSALLDLSKLEHSVFRIGSHHFAFILPQLSNPAFVPLAVNRVQSALSEDLQMDAGMVAVQVVVGVAVSHGGKRDAMSTLAAAEDSLSNLKRGGKLQIEELVGQSAPPKRDYELEKLFLDALRDNEFEFHYQPKVHLASGEVRSAEALLRWFPAGREVISPTVVVELAEHMGRDYELAKWVVHNGARVLSEWQGQTDLALALNLQAGLVNHPDLCSLVEDAVALWGIKAHSLTLEITETAIMEDKESGFDNLLRLKDFGVGLSIDDFGTGYSSLSYFKHIPATELKIDRSFVARMTKDAQELELVKIMIQIAHRFNLDVVAEGVEDAQSLAMLRDLGCDYAQGFRISRPLPLPEFLAFVDAFEGLEQLSV